MVEDAEAVRTRDRHQLEALLGGVVARRDLDFDPLALRALFAEDLGPEVFESRRLEIGNRADCEVLERGRHAIPDDEFAQQIEGRGELAVAGTSGDGLEIGLEGFRISTGAGICLHDLDAITPLGEKTAHGLTPAS